MDDKNPLPPAAPAEVAISAESMSFLSRHRYFLLIFLTIIMALILTVVSMIIYYRSGALQLDLSRPGYSSVAPKVSNDENSFSDFSATGGIDAATIKQFQSLYSTQATNAKEVDAFNGDPLSPSALGLTSADASPNTPQ